MPRKRPWRCRSCGGWSHEVGTISWTGLCYPCAAQRITEHNEQIAAKSGPEYEKWLDACAAEYTQRAANIAARRAASS